MFSKEERIKRSKTTHEKWREKNRKRLTANTIRWKKNNPIKYILTRTKFRAKKHKLDFTIDETNCDVILQRSLIQHKFTGPVQHVLLT